MKSIEVAKQKNQTGEIEFFIVVPLGFERLADVELNLKIPGLAPAQLEKGGLQVHAPKELVSLLNARLKIPTAVYARVDRFKVKDFPKLYKKVSSVKWGTWLLPENFSVSVSSHGSRLKLKNRIEKTVLDGIARHFQMQPPKKWAGKIKPAPVEVLVRLFDDECTLSINTSGESLFKRGYKSMSAVAPIRENLAAGLYFALTLKFGKIAEVFDPMAGTGTLLSEALTFYQPISGRPFAYSTIPTFADITTQEVTGPSGGLVDEYHIPKLTGVDKEPKSLQIANENILNAMNSSGLDPASSRKKINLKVLDVFQDRKLELSDLPKGFKRIGIVNPPYGERLSLPKPPQTFYPELARVMEEAEMDGFGWIVPQRYCRLIPQKLHCYECQDVLNFENGGIPVQFQIWARNNS